VIIFAMLLATAGLGEEVHVRIESHAADGREMLLMNGHVASLAEIRTATAAREVQVSASSDVTWLQVQNLLVALKMRSFNLVLVNEPNAASAKSWGSIRLPPAGENFIVDTKKNGTPYGVTVYRDRVLLGNDEVTADELGSRPTRSSAIVAFDKDVKMKTVFQLVDAIHKRGSRILAVNCDGCWKVPESKAVPKN
jgi:hypothetical protein